MNKSEIILDRCPVEVIERILNSGERVEIIPQKNSFMIARIQRGTVKFENVHFSEVREKIRFYLFGSRTHDFARFCCKAFQDFGIFVHSRLQTA